MQVSYPLIDLHRHLEGCVRPATMIELGAQHGLSLPAWTVDELRPHIQLTSPAADLMDYFTRLELMRYCMFDYEAIRRITLECLEDAHREGIHYLELRFSPTYMAELHELDADGVVAAVCDGLEEALRTLPIQAKLIGIMSRSYGPDACWRELEAIIRGRDRGVVAVDLAGDEAGYPAQLYVEHFHHACDAGMRITVHAGETTSADEVERAVTLLGAERLGHAVRAVDAPAVMDLIAERSIGIESCPTSNINTRVVMAFAHHPLAVFLRRGLRATLNTDATVVNAIDLASEYRVAREEIGLSEDEVSQLGENAFRAAFLSQDEQTCLLSGSVDQDC